ncbi:isochorismatase family protein [Klebsiella pneumoniae]|nr:isochorismatase family protein [Klebsiella pneumoniae]MDV5394814.1 isochorismatase family protein [Klebsiella pneumoniae]MDV5441090.1 isochorismatase family protein [Klebsiella pneumoniae]MDV5614984.1 isochorismatase family protein [Klebsiella pneumoniae]MDV5687291.1 isochorismatase family protein [Klebsiella pneumoniae]MDW3753008.1 isochorismatase family protein [Klebsiella pneumoniae]
MKQITGVYTAPAQHWVGDGFPVRSMFSYQTHGQQLSPFLLLDYAGPYTFPAGSEKRGVGEHPHRGFETVTIVYAGEVEHRDSTGRGGVIGPGDVQWMTAGAGIPVITTASVPQGPNGPLIPEIHENAPHAKYIARKGEINAWDNPEFVAAVKATGRKTLIIAGTITSVCMAFPAIAAVADGYKVFAVIDASGTYSKMAQEITLARVVQAGVVPMDTAAVASELQRTWNRPDAAEWAEVYTKVFPAYQLLIESYSKAQDVVKNNEQLDSQR